MNILNIMQCTNLGGMEQASLRLMTGLQQRGHTCRVLSLNPIGGLAPLLERNGIPAEGMAYRGWGGWRSARVLRNKLATIEDDAVIMTGHNLLAMSLLSARYPGGRVLAMHFHHKGVKPNWQWRLIYALARRRFSYITYPSDFIRREAVELCQELAPLSLTIRNPLPLPETPNEKQRRVARERLGLPMGQRLVGNAGWLIERKRFDVFLRVAHQVAIADPAVRFVIAGGGEEKPRLERIAAELALSDKIFWLGWQADMAGFYQAIDVLLFNSDWDAFPTTPLEAMSYGIPVAASVLNGGLGEVMEGAPLGRLYDRHDVGGLAATVLEYLKGIRPEAREAVRRHVGEICSQERCVAEIERVLCHEPRPH